MEPKERLLGIMRPMGGGDPIPLTKGELTIGRRRTCDIQLDFENISGRHCVMNFIRGVWHIRDLKSTNGTFVNRQKVEHDHGIMPDDEVRLATHCFTIDYEPVAPSSLMQANTLLEEEMTGHSRVPSLTELAGIETEDSARRPAARRPVERPAPVREQRPPSFVDAVPAEFEAPKPSPNAPSSDEFLNLIEGEIKPPNRRR